MNKQMNKKKFTDHQRRISGTGSPATNAGLKSQIPTIATDVATVDTKPVVTSSIWLTSDENENGKRLLAYIKRNGRRPNARKDSEQTEEIVRVPHTYSLFGDE